MARARAGARLLGAPRTLREEAMSRDTSKPPNGLRVLIVGGGVAGLETMLALRAIAEERVDIELVAPEPQFWYRPLAVAEPFAAGPADTAVLVAAER